MSYKVMVTEDLLIIGDDRLFVFPKPDVADWLVDRLGKQAQYSTKYGWKGKWTCSSWFSNEPCFGFMDPNDAVMFKLTWGGQ